MRLNTAGLWRRAGSVSRVTVAPSTAAHTTAGARSPMVDPQLELLEQVYKRELEVEYSEKLL